MIENIRTFIAIELNSEIRSELAGLQSALKKSEADVKWVEPESIHLTLKFLGHIDKERIKGIENILSEAAKNHRPFILSLKEIGAFPKLSLPRIIWAGVDEGASETTQIAKELEDRLENIGIPKEDKGFHPHLTLGRVKTSRNKDKLKSIIETIKFEPTSKMDVDHLTLFRSQLTPQGPIYTPLFIAKMQST